MVNDFANLTITKSVKIHLHAGRAANLERHDMAQMTTTATHVKPSTPRRPMGNEHA